MPTLLHAIKIRRLRRRMPKSRQQRDKAIGEQIVSEVLISLDCIYGTLKDVGNEGR